MRGILCFLWCSFALSQHLALDAKTIKPQTEPKEAKKDFTEESHENSEKEGDPSANQSKAFPKTKTEGYAKSFEICSPRIRELCLTTYCPMYCRDRYGRWPHDAAFKEKECTERCKEHCDLEKKEGPFDGILYTQLQTQLQACMKEMPTQKDFEGDDHAWISNRTNDFKNMEERLKKEKESIEAKKKERQKIESDKEQKEENPSHKKAEAPQEK